TVEIDAVNHLQTTGTVDRKLLSGTKTSRDSKVKYYEVIISIDSCHSIMTPGMSASCDIIVSEVKDTLVVPSVALFEEKDARFVYLSDGKKYHKRYVQTSQMNSSSGVISEGLKEGDVIALSEPSPGMLSEAETTDIDSVTSMLPDSAALYVDADSISVSDSLNSLKK
ncbi:MAG TPA: hypothetical protein VE870_10190, partial [Bacteroidales bacterium]|nr:hypothetical protein [Bacteroidales bacterium]